MVSELWMDIRVSMSTFYLKRTQHPPILKNGLLFFASKAPNVKGSNQKLNKENYDGFLGGHLRNSVHFLSQKNSKFDKQNLNSLAVVIRSLNG